ncbi:MAG TPA: hypothetical protein VH639_09085 [Bryobacteraceae bacterium]|jgi:hypothetical protein
MGDGRSEYTEAEAAQELGVSVERLRTMVRACILDSDDELKNLPGATFQRSDLLILRLLAAQSSTET